MSKELRKILWPRRRFLAAAGAGGALLALPAAPRAEPQKSDLVWSGSVEINQVQVAFIFSGNVGGGTLSFEGKAYKFTLGGLGVGGIGASSINARGTVYNMKRLADFPGAYGQVRWGWAAGDQSGGKLWLQNPPGVVMELEAERQGLMLSLGADAIYVDLD